MEKYLELFKGMQIGSIQLPQRVLMAPMTRNRAQADATPTDLMTEYYRQRASAGLIVTEMTVVSARGRAYMNAPGIYTSSHVDGWRKVTQAVHEQGGRIFLQIAHGGRISHSLLLDGLLPVAPSALRPAGHVYTPQGKLPYETPHALSEAEIGEVLQEFGAATALAKEAGFDGVELHAANGYLLDQFLRSGTNQRTDAYGGSLGKRLRFLREVVESSVAAWGPERVGVRLSPFGSYNDMHDDTPESTFAAAAEMLSGRGLAYLHVMETFGGDVPHEDRLTPKLKKLFGGPVIVNQGFDAQTADEIIAKGLADAVAFGVPFLANPDLPQRLRSDAPLNPPDMSTFYGGGARGYTDYPTLSQA